MPDVYLNGEFLPADKACIPVLDRGFIFGDSVYEVIPVYGAKMFRLEQHLQRLDNSLAGVRLANPMTHEAWEKVLDELVTRNHGGDMSIYLQITRGVSTRDHAFPVDTRPTVFAMCSPVKSPASDIFEKGVLAITAEDIRWKRCNLKTTSLLPNILLRQQAIDAKAYETILIRDGQVTEGTSSNVFIVRNNTLITPPPSELLLPGITRDLVLELASENNIDNSEDTISEKQLRQADEIWLSSSIREIIPVTQLDDKTISGGAPGPLWRQMANIFQSFKRI